MSTQRFWVIAALLVASILGFTLSMMTHRENIKQDNEVATAQVIQTFHNPESFAKQLVGNPHAGEIVYQSYCSHCHANKPQIPVTAPRIKDAAQWAALNTLGEDKLLQLTIAGHGAMPARGGCFECDEKSLRLALQYLLLQVKKEGAGD